MTDDDEDDNNPNNSLEETNIRTVIMTTEEEVLLRSDDDVTHEEAHKESMTSRTVTSSTAGYFDSSIEHAADPTLEEDEENDDDSNDSSSASCSSSGHPILRHDEQACEAHYDGRDQADDDTEKGKIRFPQHVLFGRQEESRRLQDLLVASMEHETLKTAFLEGVSGVGKSALVWESLLYHDKDVKDSSHGTPPRLKRRLCWTMSGKYNHNSTSQPFSAIMHSLDQLAALIMREARPCLDKKSSASLVENGIVAVSRQFVPWYDSDDAYILMAFCPSIESVHGVMKKIYRRNRKSGGKYLPRHEGLVSSSSNHRRAAGGRSPRNFLVKRRSNGEISDASSVVSEDATSSSGTDPKSKVASNDIQQIALSIKAFLRYLTTPSRPLIWFLDDLQWADVCSLQLLQQLLVNSVPSVTDATSENTPEDLDGLGPLLGMERVTMTSDTKDVVVGIFVGAFRPTSGHEFSEIGQLPDPSLGSSLRKVSAQNAAFNGDIPPLLNMLNSVVSVIPTTLQLEISNLPPRAILDFCCATLEMEEEEAWPLTNALYSATMGNIFHCRQALEHLVRSNFLYYDVMFFSWTYNLPADGSALQDCVAESCQDVLKLVNAKLHSCNDLVRQVLIRAAYTENTVFGAMLLLSLLKATGYPDLTISDLQGALDDATDQGLLLKLTWEGSPYDIGFENDANLPINSLRYKFSHDKVKEATYNLLSESGSQRNKVLLPLSTVLIQWALQSAPSLDVSSDPQPSDGGLTTVPYTVAKPSSPATSQDWMWFVGVQHLNSIPLDNILGLTSESFQVSSNLTLPAIEITRKRLAQWNKRVAEMSIAHSSYDQAVMYLKAAISYLEPDRMWVVEGPYYRLSLQLYNRLMEISIAQGQYDETKNAIAMVLTKADSLRDKITAFSTKIKLAVESNDRNCGFGVTESLNVLRLFGMRFPSEPNAIDTNLERMKFKMVLQGRSINVLGELDLIPPEDPKGDVMRLLAQLSHLVLLAKKHQHANLSEVIALRSMRWTLENGISQHFALILSEYSSPLRSRGELGAAGKYAAIVKRLFHRFADERGAAVIRTSDFLFCEFILHAGMLPLQNHPFAESLEKYIDIYRHALANGAAEYAMSSAMHYPLTYFICGRPLNSLLDAKLVLFQDKAVQLKMHGFGALFHGARQVLYNLQGKNNKPASTEIQNEERVLSALEGRTREMTRRDFAIYRMMLAVTFGDLDCMEMLTETLDDAPLFDLSLARQYLRLTYCGVAAYLLAREGRSPKKNLKIASDIVKELKKLDRADGTAPKDLGSVNCRPIVLCLAAVETDKVEDYDIAIAACSRRQLVHLQALLCELAGRCYLRQSVVASPSTRRKHWMTNNSFRGSGSRMNSGEGTYKPDAGKTPLSKGPLNSDDNELGQQYLGKAMWLYQDWNALAKVSQLKQQYPILQSLSRRAAGFKPSGTSSIGSLYSNESASKSQGALPVTYFPADRQLGRSSECESIYSAESQQSGI